EGVTKKFLTDEVETHALAGIHLDINSGEWVSISRIPRVRKSTPTPRNLCRDECRRARGSPLRRSETSWLHLLAGSEAAWISIRTKGDFVRRKLPVARTYRVENDPSICIMKHGDKISNHSARGSSRRSESSRRATQRPAGA